MNASDDVASRAETPVTAASTHRNIPAATPSVAAAPAAQPLNARLMITARSGPGDADTTNITPANAAYCVMEDIVGSPPPELPVPGGGPRRNALGRHWDKRYLVTRRTS
ncbi:hypothetical protein NN4_73670 [Nocardia ninae NBRC 108245]|uniref:Uncharacterized protein n=1 Tax=Nocardia ninae NBRC 108245 TaxID=1210091 RepID=A0A511MRN1_9NOCA|nr:hypothetical protein NN4_73670 [Nocardia ninae NBRC 108245]